MKYIQLTSMLFLSLMLGLGCEDDSNNTNPPQKDMRVQQDQTSDLPVDLPDMLAQDMSKDIESAAFGYDSRPSNTTCLAKTRPRSGADVKLTQVFKDVALRKPIELVQAPGALGQWFVVEQGGRIVRIDADTAQDTDFADLSDRTQSVGERGLLGLAFDPKWNENQFVYFSYTYTKDNILRSRVSRAQFDKTTWQADLSQEKVILEVEQPYTNHNGGQIAFGPDGFLYIALGDGGSAGDPLNSGQDTQTLLGAILRIDVHGGDPYSIPADNPFKAGGGKAEIYAWGLRNPWKMSFDPETGTLWSGDVGQGAKEEVNIIERGANYGWKVREGDVCYRNHPDCEKAFKDPVVVYPHSEGKSITGGYVYRGEQIPGLVGRYVYGDYVSGKLWAVDYDAQTGEPKPQVLIESTGFQLSAFGQDQQTGDVYVLDYDARNARGAGVYKLEPAMATQGEDNFPKRLSETGCVAPNDIKKPAPGMIPYTVVEPFWSDGAKKERFIALPDNTTITPDEKGWTYPVGTVLVKHFELNNKRVETRLFMKHADGFWGGYSYEWLDDQSDAILLLSDKRKTVGNQQWIYPSRSQCLSCHNSTAGDVLGFVNGQLAGDTIYPTNKRAPQRDTLNHISLFMPTLMDSDARPSTKSNDGTLTQRAKVYMDVNCAYCHQPDGVARGELDLRYGTPFGQMGLCDKDAQLDKLDIDGGKLMAPGQPDKSIIIERIKRRDTHAMPPIGSTLVDMHGVGLLSEWITQTTQCP